MTGKKSKPVEFIVRMAVPPWYYGQFRGEIEADAARIRLLKRLSDAVDKLVESLGLLEGRRIGQCSNPYQWVVQLFASDDSITAEQVAASLSRIKYLIVESCERSTLHSNTVESSRSLEDIVRRRPSNRKAQREQRAAATRDRRRNSSRL
jgi:hypothetical protein